MRQIASSAYEIAERYIGMSEVPGTKDNPAILAMLKLDNQWPEGDEVPWCSGFVNWIAWHLRLPRSKSLMARSWLAVGEPIDHTVYRDDDSKLMERGFDVVILKRGGGDQPGPEVLKAPGHVGFYAGHDSKKVFLLGGNQGDSVSVAAFDWDRILGIRRLA